MHILSLLYFIEEKQRPTMLLSILWYQNLSTLGNKKSLWWQRWPKLFSLDWKRGQPWPVATFIDASTVRWLFIKAARQNTWRLSSFLAVRKGTLKTQLFQRKNTCVKKLLHSFFFTVWFKHLKLKLHVFSCPGALYM